MQVEMSSYSSLNKDIIITANVWGEEELDFQYLWTLALGWFMRCKNWYFKPGRLIYPDWSNLSDYMQSDESFVMWNGMNGYQKI